MQTYATLLATVIQKLRRMQADLAGGTPYIATDHHYADVGENHLSWWTNGFWGGMLWQLYAATNDAHFAAAAKHQAARLDPVLAQYDRLDHDVGFMWENLALAQWRLTKDEAAQARAMKAALILASRYNPAGAFIKAWNAPEQAGQLIIDCLMNLPLLHWASGVSGDPRFDQIAYRHAQTALKVLFRPDGSVAHIAQMDPQTGEFQQTLAGQGCAVGSAWSRGQAWALYGMALMYRDHGDPAFLEAAKRSAHYFLAAVSETRGLAKLDFRQPPKPAYVDASASAIAVCGLLTLAQQVPPIEQAFYQQAAETLFDQLTKAAGDLDLTHHELLQKSSARYQRAEDREVPIIYGDAFYLEALLRLSGHAAIVY